MDLIPIKQFNYYTDGSTRGNPGQGGYGVVCLDENEIIYSYSKQYEHTTNNRMELEAILHVFRTRRFSKFEKITIYSDSAYCVNMLNDWIWKWALNSWCNSKGKRVENLDLVQEAYVEMKEHPNARIVHIKGHNGILGNELADALATDNIPRYKMLVKKNALEENYNFVSTREA